MGSMRSLPSGMALELWLDGLAQVAQPKICR
jgi:hypothetical protein